MMFIPINYNDLNARQQENYNFHKVAGYLANYGYNSLKLSDDWQGADFLACHINGSAFLKVQLKGRMTIEKKYIGKNIHIAFLNDDNCYVYPHDNMMEEILLLNKINLSKSWASEGEYSWPKIPKWAQPILANYKV